MKYIEYDTLRPAAAETVFPGGYASWRLCSTAPALIIGDPASLYVCSNEDDLYADDVLERQAIWRATPYGDEPVVTGSTAPRVPEVDLTIIELQAMIDAHARAMNDAPTPFTYHYHGQAWWALRKLRDRRLALETTRDMLR